MWKLIQKGLKCNKSVKSSYVVICHDDKQPTHSCVRKTSNRWVTRNSQYGSSYEDSGGGGPEQEWKQRMNAFHFDIWSRHGYHHFLEAVGWGSAVITGIQITDLCYRSHHSRPCENKQCMLKRLMSCVPSNSLCRISDFLTTYSDYAASLVSRTILPVKFILPVQQSSSPIPSSVFSSEQSQRTEANNSHQVSSSPDLNPASVDSSTVNHSFFPKTDGLEPLQSSITEDSSWHQLVDEHLTAVNLNVSALKCARLGDFVSAVRIWSHACCNAVHSPSSLYNLAICYEQGLGVDTDQDKAAELYLRASNLGHAKSAFNLAVMIMKKSSDDDTMKQAMDLLVKASDMGLKEAQRELGVLYTQQSIMDRAAKLFEKAAAQMDAKATYFLGICFERGWGVAANHAKAASLYKSAVQLGCTDALFNLAVFFEQGMGGLPVDEFEAVRYYQAAAGAGDMEAAERLNIMEKKHPLLTAIVSDSGSSNNVKYVPLRQSSANFDLDNWSPGTQLFDFSLSSSCKSVDENVASFSSTSGSGQSDTSTSLGWQVTTRRKKTGKTTTPLSNKSASSSSRDGTSNSRKHDYHSSDNDSLDHVSSLPQGAFGTVAVCRTSSR